MKLGTWILSLMILVAVGLLWSGALVQANDEPGEIVFKNTKSFAPVVFYHSKHKAAGVKCSECHDSLFKKKQGSTDVKNALTMKALRDGKFCGTCHNGSRAFSAKKNCKKCHPK